MHVIEPWPNCKGVYFVAGAGTDLVKIGRAVDVSDRLRGLQLGSPVDLVLLAIERDPNRESEFHWWHYESRVRGEWFRLDHSLLKNILTVRRTVQPWEEPIGHVKKSKYKPWPAWMNSGIGRWARRQGVRVVDETPKFFRVEPYGNRSLKLPTERWIDAGETALVQKHLITKMEQP